MLRIPGVVTIEESQKLTPSMLDRCVPGARAAFVLLLDVHNANRIRLQDSFELGSIGRTVVDDDRFEILKSLRHDRIETARDQLSSFIAGDNDADSRGRIGGNWHDFPITYKLVLR